MNGKIEKYLDLSRKPNKMWNMRVTVIPLAGGALGTIHKGLEKRLKELEMRGRIETI